MIEIELEDLYLFSNENKKVISLFENDQDYYVVFYNAFLSNNFETWKQLIKSDENLIDIYKNRAKTCFLFEIYPDFNYIEIVAYFDLFSESKNLSFDIDEAFELVKNYFIRLNKVIKSGFYNPIIVKLINNKFVIIEGHHRFMLCKLNLLNKIKCHLIT